jgi:transposase-like protein
MQNSKPSQWEPREKLELILLHLSKEEAITTICREAGVSRTLFYRWIKQVGRALQEALESKKRGRRAKSILESPREAEALQSRILELEREVAGLRKERDRFKLITEVAQRVIRRNAWAPRGPGTRRRGRPKKNASAVPPIAASTPSTGERQESSEQESPPSPPPGASTEPPTGVGLPASSKEPGPDIPGSAKT